MNKILAWVVIALAVAGVTFAAISAAASREAVQIVKDIKDRRPKVPTYVSTWVDADHVTQTVNSTLGEFDPEETMTECAARHKSAVDALKALFPPA